MAKMRANVFRGKNDFRVEEVERPSAGVGLIALAFMLSAELTVVLGLRGLTFSGYVATRDTVSGAAYLLMLVVFAVMPWLVARGRSTRRGGSLPPTN